MCLRHCIVIVIILLEACLLTMLQNWQYKSNNKVWGDYINVYWHFESRPQNTCVFLFGQSVIGTVNGWRPTWNFSSVSPSPMWRSRSPLACPILPAAVSTVCLGCRKMTSPHSLHWPGQFSHKPPWIIWNRLLDQNHYRKPVCNTSSMRHW